MRREAKVPKQVNGRNASSTSPRTWASFSEVFESSVGDGVGFVLNGDGIVCVDLDHCLDARGVVTSPTARRVLELAGDTFVEVSLSGDGLHVWGRSSVPVGGCVGDGVEVYGTGRYIAVTGQRFRGSELRDITRLVRSLVP